MKRSLYGVSILTLAGLYGLLAAVIILAFILADLPITTALLVSIITLLIQFIIAPWITDLTMRWFYKVKFHAEVPEYLSKFIDEVCQKNNIKKRPKIGLIDDGAPNAFTYGRTKIEALPILFGVDRIFDMLRTAVNITGDAACACIVDRFREEEA